MVEPKYERKRGLLGETEGQPEREDKELVKEEEVEVKKAKLEVKEEGDVTKQEVEEETVVLNNGARMPKVQFGTYKLKGDEAFKATLSALQQGYRGLDTATCYDNEKQVGEAIRASGVAASSLFLQTKLWRSYSGRDPKTGKPRCDTWLRKSLKLLGVERIDLWLMHWPGPGRHLNYPPVKMGMDRPKEVKPENASRMAPTDWSPAMRLETYRYMAAHVGRGVGALGVCNFSPRQLRELLQYCEEHQLPRPSVVQNECHPYLPAGEVRQLCREEGIVFQAYASLGAGALDLLTHPTVAGVARERGVTPGQVLLRWGLQQGATLLPKSSQPHRQKENLAVLGWSLPPSSMAQLALLARGAAGQHTMAGWLREHDPDFY